MKEDDIRPKALFDKYLELSIKDTENHDMNDSVIVPCPGCGENDYDSHMVKNGFNYDKCNTCNTLFCNPRPSNKSLSDFYSNSESNVYWANIFYPAVMNSRIERLIKPKAEKIYKLFNLKASLQFGDICDFGCGHGLLLQELKAYYVNAKLYGVEPSVEMARICRSKGIEIYESLAENLEIEDAFDLVVSSEVVEHVYSTEKYLQSMYRSLKGGGYCLITGLGYEGYDILTLQEKSKSVSPPHHLNFLSVLGFEKLFLRAGFMDVEVITPGELDVDIVLNSERQDEFISVLKSRGEGAISDFQEFLRKHKLSSHVWIVARK